MTRSILTSLVVVGLAGAAWAQTAGVPTAAPQNSGGTPGSWVQAAIARHKALTDARVNAARGGAAAGDRSGLAVNSNSGTSASTSLNVGGSPLDSLLNLFGGSGSPLSSLAGLLGTTLNVTGSTAATGSNAAGGGTATDRRLDALLALRDANRSKGTGKSDTATQQAVSSAGGAGANVTRVGGAAVNRLPKAEQRLQSAVPGTTTQPSFAVRWANAMLSTFFTAVTTGFQSAGFITFLKDSLRPLNYPTESGDDGSDSGGGSGGSTGGGTGGSTGGSGSGGSGSSGGGIEDIPPGGGDSGSVGSAL